MSFASDLTSKVNLYTDFTIFGKRIQLPYKLGAKNTPTQISSNIGKNIAPNADHATLQNWVTKNPAQTAVDCSGLAYFVLNEASGGKVMAAFGNTSYAYGVNAATLTSTAYGSKITKANDLTPGCLFNSDNGKHVLVVYSVTKNSAGQVTRVDYAHSNGSKGPHKGYITIGDPSQDLKHSSQTWYDSAYTDAQAKNYYNYAMRLNCLPVA